MCGKLPQKVTIKQNHDQRFFFKPTTRQHWQRSCRIFIFYLTREQNGDLKKHIFHLWYTRKMCHQKHNLGKVYAQLWKMYPIRCGCSNVCIFFPFQISASTTVKQPLQQTFPKSHTVFTLQLGLLSPPIPSLSEVPKVIKFY